MSVRLLGAVGVLLLCTTLMAQTSPSAPAEPAAPAAAAKTTDLAASLDPYDPAAERTRFLAAAGVDNELDEKEFQANKSAGEPFVRPYDRWDSMLRYDADHNGRLDWFEADAYRQALRKELLAAFDKDHNGKLDSTERQQASRALASGPMGRQPGGTDVPAADRRWGAPAAPTDQPDRPAPVLPDYRQLQRQYDADGDGKLSDQERKAMFEDLRRRAEKANWDYYKKWDADGDGQLSDEERQTMQRDLQARWDEQRRKTIEKYDANGDGQLSEEERKAMYDDLRRQAEQQQREMIKKYDADGDGQLSNEDRKVMYDDLRRQNEKANWDYYKKWDADGDGQLSDEERKKMVQDRGGGVWGGVPIQIGGARGSATVVIVGGQGPVPVVVGGGQGAAVTGGAGD